MDYTNELYHYGIKGMKWGVRRARKNDVSGTSSKKRKTDNDDNQTTKKKGLSDRQKTALKIGAAAAGTALAAYGAYKVGNLIKEKRSQEAIKAGKRFAEQQAYLQRNIKNIQSHVDPASKLYKGERWNNSYNATIKSRVNSIKGDRKLYGEKAVKGRDALKEARDYMYESLRKEDYWNKYYNKPNF